MDSYIDITYTQIIYTSLTHTHMYIHTYIYAYIYAYSKLYGSFLWIDFGYGCTHTKTYKD